MVTKNVTVFKILGENFPSGCKDGSLGSIYSIVIKVTDIKQHKWMANCPMIDTITGQQKTVEVGRASDNRFVGLDNEPNKKNIATMI